VRPPWVVDFRRVTRKLDDVKGWLAAVVMPDSRSARSISIMFMVDPCLR
jgi:hypothetical protein